MAQRGVGRGVRLAGDVAVDLREAVTVEIPSVIRYRWPTVDSVYLVETPNQLLRLVGSDLAEEVAEDAGVEQSDRRASAERRVGACPGVAHGDQPGRDGFAVDDEAAVSGPRSRPSPARR